VPHLDVRSARSSDATHARVGLIVPRYGHTAVARNRLKRRLRELTRTRLLPVLPPVDLVIRALPSAYAASFETLARGIERTVDVMCGGC
jgi:ribonuclease P protein component